MALNSIPLTWIHFFPGFLITVVFKMKECNASHLFLSACFDYSESLRDPNKFYQYLSYVIEEFQWNLDREYKNLFNVLGRIVILMILNS